MRFRFMPGVLVGLSSLTGCENTKTVTNEESSAPATAGLTKKVDQIVEVSCGQCQFTMVGNGCDLALHIDGKTYYVDSCIT